MFRLLCMVALAVTVTVVFAGVAAAPRALAAGRGQSLCIAHHPQGFVADTASCTGHDEPEIDPLSNAPGSAQDLTWTVVLPTDQAGTTAGQEGQVDSVGPTFWIGGTVTDPNSLFGEAFLELQFYPNSIVTNCSAGGGYNVTFRRTPTRRARRSGNLETGNSESAAFNAELVDNSTGGPLLMHAGRHDHRSPVRDSGQGRDAHHRHRPHDRPLGDDRLGQQGRRAPAAAGVQRAEARQRASRGLVNDAPNSLVWEIGHTGNYTTPAGQYCIPGAQRSRPATRSSNPSWLRFKPLQIKGVTFGNGSTAELVGGRDVTGGEAEVLGELVVGPTGCSGYGGPAAHLSLLRVQPDAQRLHLRRRLPLVLLKGLRPGTPVPAGQGLHQPTGRIPAVLRDDSQVVRS